MSRYSGMDNDENKKTMQSRCAFRHFFGFKHALFVVYVLHDKSKYPLIY